jgi:hypothetical protein
MSAVPAIADVRVVALERQKITHSGRFQWLLIALIDVVMAWSEEHPPL